MTIFTTDSNRNEIITLIETARTTSYREQQLYFFYQDSFKVYLLQNPNLDLELQWLFYGQPSYRKPLFINRGLVPDIFTLLYQECIEAFQDEDLNPVKYYHHPETQKLLEIHLLLV